MFLTRYHMQTFKLRVWESNPLFLAYEASVIFRFTHPQVGMTGFEPAASASQMRRSDQTDLHPDKQDS